MEDGEAFPDRRGDASPENRAFFLAGHFVPLRAPVHAVGRFRAELGEGRPRNRQDVGVCFHQANGLPEQPFGVEECQWRPRS